MFPLVQNLLRVPEVARRLNVSERHVWRLIAERRLPSVKLYGARRVPESVLNDIIEEQLVAGDVA